MSRVVKIAAAVVGVLLVVGVSLLLFGIDLWLYSIRPGAFDESSSPPEPRYAERSAWWALPETDDPADLLADGHEPAPNAAADVFFVHPTNYLGDGAMWNGAVDSPVAEEMSRFSIANQATAFNGCCRVFAPRYRSASLYAFVDTGPDTRRALDLAYGDVARAFQHFIDQWSGDRPFVLAGHSQGSTLLVRLLEEAIDGTELADRMVAAYVIGHRVPLSNFESLATLRPCESRDDTRCIVSLNAMREGTDVRSGRVRLLNWSGDEWHPIRNDEPILCVHPYSWIPGDTTSIASNGGARAAVHSRETLDPSALLFGSTSGFEISALPSPFDPGMTVRCTHGFVTVSGLNDPRFAESSPIDAEGALHVYEYNLFYAAIRANAVDRVRSWLAARSEP